MNSSGETFSQTLLGHRPLSRYFQIDRLVKRFTGLGSYTSPAFHLPSGRYTVFVEADPPRAAHSFVLVGDSGFRLQDDWSRVPNNVANVPVPLVQQPLPRGNYKVAIEMTNPQAGWDVQLVLNSMLSWEAVPRPWQRPSPPQEPIRLSKGAGSNFRIQQTGPYAMHLRIGNPDPRFPSPIDPHCRFRLSLRAPIGHSFDYGNKTGWNSFRFFSAGNWTVTMDTECDWSLVLTQLSGRRGGGTQF